MSGRKSLYRESGPDVLIRWGALAEVVVDLRHWYKKGTNGHRAVTEIIEAMAEAREIDLHRAAEAAEEDEQRSIKRRKR